MVRRFIKLMLYGLCSVAMHAHAFELTVKNTSVEHGKPIWLTLSTPRSTPSLDDIDFSQLENDFEVISDKNAIRQTGQGQTWRIRLYPRMQKSLTIPAIKFASNRSRAININVTSPLDNKTGQTFAVDYQLSTTQPWLRQQVLAQYRITSPRAELVLKPQQTTHAHLQVIPLNTQTSTGDKRSQHQTGWALFANKTGAHHLKLPALHYVRDGVVTHRFYPPPITLKVKPLPAYLPGNIPVGKLRFHVIHKPALVLNSRLSELSVQFQGEGIPSQWLPDLRHLFNSNYQLNTYPVETSTRQTETASITSRHTWRIPFKTTQQGRIDLPNTSLHYFDPDTGKLAKLDIQLPKLISLSLWLVILLIVIGIAVILWLANTLYHRLIPHWRCFKVYRTTLKDIDKLQTPQDVRQLIRQLSEAEGWSENLSLRQWQSRLPTAAATPANHIQQQLEPALYHGHVFNIEPMKIWIRALCVCRWPILKTGFNRG